MKVRCLLDGGTISTIPCVKWHDASLFVEKKFVRAENLQDIVGAEAPLEICEISDSKQILKKVPFIDNYDFWNLHA